MVYCFGGGKAHGSAKMKNLLGELARPSVAVLFHFLNPSVIEKLCPCYSFNLDFNINNFSIAYVSRIDLDYIHVFAS